MEYFTFPMKTLNVSQTYGDHSNHIDPNGRDYPIDIWGEDDTRSAAFAPVDLRVIAKTGEYKNWTNVVWLQTVRPVKTPTFEDYAFIMLAHWNDGDPYLSKWPVGSIIPKGKEICLEGTDPPADGNHFHMVCGRGYADGWIERKYEGSGICNGDTKPPEQVLYIDTNFTKVGNMKGLNFKYLPTMYGTPVGRNNVTRQVNVVTTMQNAYSSAGGAVKGEMRPGIYNILQQSGEYIQVESGLWVKLASGKVVILEAEIVPSTLNAIAHTTVGSNVTVVINKKITGVTHTLRYIFGSNHVTLATGVDSNYQFTLTKDLYYHMLNSKSAPMTIYCDTYRNGTLIGTTSTSFTVMGVDSDLKPSVTIETTIDDKTKELTNDEDTIISGVTNLTYQLASELKYGARRNRYQVGTDAWVQDTEESGTLEKVLLVDSLKYRVIDSRGYDDWYTKSFTVVPYVPVRLSYRVVRENEKALDEVMLHYEGEFYNATFGSKEGAVHNQLELELYYQEDGEVEWTKISTLNPTIVGNKYHEDVLLSTRFDKDTVYNFKMIAKDRTTSVEIERILYDEQGQFFDFVFPVGSGFIDFTNTDYSNYLGFTWEKTLMGNYSVGYDSTQVEFNTLGKKGGSKFLQSHYHVFSGTTSESGNHMHSTKAVEAYSKTNPSKTVLRPNGYSGDMNANDGGYAGNHTHTYSGTTLTAGSGFGENLPPYEVVHYWKRIA